MNLNQGLTPEQREADVEESLKLFRSPKPLNQGLTPEAQEREAYLAGLLDLSHAVYCQDVKVAGYSRKCSVLYLSGHNTPKACRQLSKLLEHAPNKMEASSLAVAHAAAADKLSKLWVETLEAQAQKHFGRPWRVTDYKISGIGREEFDEDAKDNLRRAAHGQTAHKGLALVWLHFARKAAA